MIPFSLPPSHSLFLLLSHFLYFVKIKSKAKILTNFNFIGFFVPVCLLFCFHLNMCVCVCVCLRVREHVFVLNTINKFKTWFTLLLNNILREEREKIQSRRTREHYNITNDKPRQWQQWDNNNTTVTTTNKQAGRQAICSICKNNNNKKKYLFFRYFFSFSFVKLNVFKLLCKCAHVT